MPVYLFEVPLLYSFIVLKHRFLFLSQVSSVAVSPIIQKIALCLQLPAKTDVLPSAPQKVQLTKEGHGLVSSNSCTLTGNGNYTLKNYW